jgi:cellulose synthase/poly-beta-1,6-N-acetylglucosamine synthase-like glycosyltransferase/DNA-binding beta-propeller fold protein YncE
VFLKLVLLIVAIVILFSVTLLGSFYGFQTFYDLRSQTIEFTADSICNEMHDILSEKSISYEQMTNAIGDKQRWNDLYFDQQEESVIEQCLQEKLPVLSSYPIAKKIGFLNGINDHSAKGTAKIIIIERDQYLRLEKFEISYTPKTDSNFKIPELYIYLVNGYPSFSDYIDLGELNTNLGGKNYRLPENYTSDYDTLIIYDVINKEEFAITKMENLFFIKDSIYNTFDQIKNIDSSTKIESKIIHERYGFFEGVDEYKAKGSAYAFYEEDKGLLDINNFEISNGRDPELYITTNSHVNKNGYWTFGPGGNMYIPNGFTNEIFIYDPISGNFIDSFVTSGSGGLNGPKDLTFSDDGKYLFVTSFFSNEVLRYDGITGNFIDRFVSRQNGNIVSPQYPEFGPDDNLYVTSGGTDEVLRYDGITGNFIDSFVTSGSGGLDLPTGLAFASNGDLYVTSRNTNEVLRYDGITGNFIDKFDSENLGGLESPTGISIGQDLNVYVVSSNGDQILRYSQNGEFQDVFVSHPSLFSPTDLSFDDQFLYVGSTNNEVLRYDGITGNFIDSFVNKSRDGIDMPTGLTIGPNGNLYATSGNTHQVFKYDPDNPIFGTEKFVTDKSNKLNQPTHLEIKDDEICVSGASNNIVNCYHSDTGDYVKTHALSFLNMLANTDGSVIGPDDEFFMSDRLTNEILQLDGTDSKLVMTSGSTLLQSPSYLTFKDNHMYVSSDNKILKFDGLTGEFEDVFVENNDGSLRNPQGLVFTNDGLVVNSYNDRLLKYDFQGKFVEEFIPSKNQKIVKPIGLVKDNHENLFTTTQQGEILKFSGGQLATLEKSIDLKKTMGEILIVDETETSIIPPDPHGIFLNSDNNMLYLSIFNKNIVLQYDLENDVISKLNFDVDLDGPEGLAFDEKNKILYISNAKNDSIVAYDLTTESSYFITKNSGDGHLSLPKGLFFNNSDGFLYIANSNNDEILKFDPREKSLNIFSNIAGGSITTGGIAFDSDEYLFVINEDNNDIYQYDVDERKFLDVFINFNDSFSEYLSEGILSTDLITDDIKLKNIVFTQNDEFLFASDPSNDQIFVYDEFGSLHDVFVDADNLEYPLDIALTSDDQYLLVSNYGKNTITRLSVSDGLLYLEDAVFANPGDHGISEITQIGFDSAENLYVVGEVKTKILKYDFSGNFLGNFDLESVYLNKLSENLLKQYTLNDIDTKQHDILVVYDNFLERPIAKMQLNDTLEFLSRINNLFYNIISIFNVIEDPQLKSKEIIKNTGFFIGNNSNAYGQIITKSVDDQLLIKIEAFSIDYLKDDYVSVPSNFDILGPHLTLCLENNSQCIAPTNSELKTNVGDNMYMLNNVDVDGDNLDNYRVLLHDEHDVLAYIPLKEYGVARISLDSFIDWMLHYLPVFPFISLILIFPIVFDYVRSIFKLLFFPILWLSKKSENKERDRNFDKKVTILIPAHNEAFGIHESIESALATDYVNKEIIVIDDGSTDDTYLIAYKFAEKGLIKLIHRDTASGSKATALNYGANYATGDYIVCMDGDTRLDKNALKNSIPHFDDDGVIALSGNVKIVSGDNGVNNTVTNLQKYEYMVAIELGRRFTSFFGILLVISGAFGIFRKNLFRGVRTFDNDTFTEDFDLTLKFRKTKGAIRFVGNSIAYTYCPNTFSVWIRQRNRWAYGQFQTLLKNKNIMTSKFSFRDKISFLDMFVLDVILALMFPVGLVVLGIISVTLYFEDNLHVLVYPLLFTMISFLMLEVLIFLYAVGHAQQGKSSSIKLIYLAPAMTFFYRPYLKMVNLRGYVRAYFKKQSSW